MKFFVDLVIIEPYWNWNHDIGNKGYTDDGYNWTLLELKLAIAQISAAVKWL